MEDGFQQEVVVPAAPVGLRDCIDGKPLLYAEVAGSLDEPLPSNPKHIRVPAHLFLSGLSKRHLHLGQVSLLNDYSS